MNESVTPRHHLKAFVHLKHFEQRRKYTNEPYINHLVAVAEMADDKAVLGYEIGLCHDLLEDTDCRQLELQNALQRFGYTPKEVFTILQGVVDLTDVYTPENFPQLNRGKRKILEAKRLHYIDANSQTVKYCDVIDNASSILQHDPKFAAIYLSEMKLVLEGMNKGNKALYKQALKAITI